MHFLLVLGLCGFVSATAVRAADPMLPVLAGDLQVSIEQAALLATAYALPYALMQLVFGPLGDGLGKSRMIQIAVMVLTVGLALSALAPGFLSLMAARALSGAFGGGIIPLSMAAIGDRVGMAERQPALSRFLLATILGQMTGGTVSSVLADAIGWRWTLGLYAVPAALATAAALLWLRERPDAPPRRAPSLADAFRRYGGILKLARARRVYLTVALEGALIYGLFPFLVPYLMSEGASSAQAGLAFAAWGVGGLGYTFLVRQILRLVGARGMMPTAGCITGAALALVPVAATWWATAALFLFVGFGFFMLHNTLQTQATEIAPAARASAMSLFAFSLFFGQGCGPIAFGAGAASLGPGASIALSGVLISILGVVAGRLIRPAGADRRV